MYAGSLEQRPVAHDGSLFMIHAHSYAIFRETYAVHERRRIAYVLMLKFVRIAVKRTDKINGLNRCQQQTFRNGTNNGVVCRQGFRSGRECKCLEFGARQFIGLDIPPVFQRRILCQQYGGVRQGAPDLIRRHKFKKTFESTLLFINVICNLTPDSKYGGTLHMSLCNRPNSWTSLLALSFFQRVMNPRFAVAVRFSAEKSLGSMSPVSRYQ